MPTITIKLPDYLAEWLEKQSRELNRPKSVIAREALRAYLNGSDEQSHTETGDLAGKFASGKKTSSNKKNLKNFDVRQRSQS